MTKEHRFYLELVGPSGSGKTTFMKFITEVCQRSKEWSVKEDGPHVLIITHHILDEPGGSL